MHLYFHILQEDRTDYRLILKNFFHNEGYDYDTRKGFPIYGKVSSNGPKGRLDETDVIEQSVNYMAVKGVKSSKVGSKYEEAPTVSRIQLLREKAEKKKIDEDETRCV